LEEYQQSISSLEHQFHSTLSMFEELGTVGVTNMSLEQRTMFERFHTCFSNMNQKLNQIQFNTTTETTSTVTPPKIMNTTTNANNSTLSLNIPQQSALNSTSMLSSTIDLSKTLEVYSSMLLDMVKDKLAKEKLK